MFVLMVYACVSVPNGSRATSPYSELIDHPEAVMRSVLAFLGERWEASVLDNIVEQPEVQFDNEDAISKVIDGTPRYVPSEQAADPEHVANK